MHWQLASSNLLCCGAVSAPRDHSRRLAWSQPKAMLCRYAEVLAKRSHQRQPLIAISWRAFATKLGHNGLVHSSQSSLGAGNLQKDRSPQSAKSGTLDSEARVVNAAQDIVAFQCLHQKEVF